MKLGARVWGLELVVVMVLAVAYVLGNWAGYKLKTGFVRKTIWDLLDLLFVPLVLALGGLWFNQQRAQTEHEIATDRQREAALQGYLDRMTELLLEKGLRTSEKEAEVRDVARAQTVTVLRRLDGERKGMVVKFLCEAGLIFLDTVPLRDLQVSVVDLSETDLSRADLSEAYLGRANLRKVNLRGAYLSRAYLNGAYLVLADLRGADLSRAWLHGADLNTADLRGADLSNAYLDGADLSRANLSEAIVTDDQLSKAQSLKYTILPNGIRCLGPPSPPPGPSPTYTTPPPPGDQTPAAGDEGGGDG